MRFWIDVMGFEVTTETPSLGFVVHRPSRIAIAVTDRGGSMRGGGFDERRCGLDHLALAVRESPPRWSGGSGAWPSTASRTRPSPTPAPGHHLNLRAPGGIPIELYVIADATVSALGLAGPEEAYAGSRAL